MQELMPNEFVSFEGLGRDRMYAKWGPGENVRVRSSVGHNHECFFERPFCCIVRRQQMADIVWAGTNICLISERALTLFRSANVSGFQVNPADVRLMFPHEPQEAVYWQLTVTGWAGVAPPESGIRRLDDPKRPGKLVYSPCINPKAVIDLQMWDGSDFFIVWPIPNYWWISPTVVEILRTNELKQFRLRPPEARISLSDEAIDGIGFMPGRLRHFFTEDRARTIGDPLGIY